MDKETRACGPWSHSERGRGRERAHRKMSFNSEQIISKTAVTFLFTIPWTRNLGQVQVCVPCDSCCGGWVYCTWQIQGSLTPPV